VNLPEEIWLSEFCLSAFKIVLKAKSKSTFIILIFAGAQRKRMKARLGSS